MVEKIQLQDLDKSLVCINYFLNDVVILFFKSVFLSPVKPWPNGLTSQRKSSTCIQLEFHLVTNLHWLWSSSNSFASQHKIFSVWPPNANWYQLISSQLCAWNLLLLQLEGTCEPTCKSVWPPIASPCWSSGLFANLHQLTWICKSIRPGLYIVISLAPHLQCPLQVMWPTHPWRKFNTWNFVHTRNATNKIE